MAFKFHVIFTSSTEVIIEAASLQEATDAAEMAARFDLVDWDLEPWNVLVQPVLDPAIEADHGVVEGTIVTIEDYRAAGKP